LGALIFYIISALVVLALFALFVRKSGLQLQYLRMKKGQKAGRIQDFLQFDWSDAEERTLRLKAFLLFPMLYPIDLDEEREELNLLKSKVKRTHIGIYLALIAFILLGIFSEKI
jgi:hypothetical protein